MVLLILEIVSTNAFVWSSYLHQLIKRCIFIKVFDLHFHSRCLSSVFSVVHLKIKISALPDVFLRQINEYIDCIENPLFLFMNQSLVTLKKIKKNAEFCLSLSPTFWLWCHLDSSVDSWILFIHFDRELCWCYDIPLWLCFWK